MVYLLYLMVIQWYFLYHITKNSVNHYIYGYTEAYQIDLVYCQGYRFHPHGVHSYSKMAFAPGLSVCSSLCAATLKGFVHCRQKKDLRSD